MQANLSIESGVQDAESRAMRRRAIIACNVGNFIELFDFMIYGFFAVALGKAFFPSGDPLVSLLSSFATYGVGFLMRPIGAIVIGAYGDKHGRRAALVLTIGVMAGATGATGLLPGYGSIGIAAPALLVICRLLQGFSTGGEWGGAAAFLVEHAPPGRRGLVGSLATVSVHLGISAASLTATLITSILSETSFYSWGWRIPFLLGFVLGPVGHYLRMKVAETPAFEKNHHDNKTPQAPILECIRLHFRAMAAAFGIATIGAANVYVLVVFLPSMAVQQLKLDSQSALLATTAASVLVTVLVPFVGALSDRIGRRGLMVLCGFGHLALGYPLFWVVIHNPSFVGMLISECIGAVLLALYSGVIPAMMSEMFPSRIRYTGLSTAYGLAVTLFGGFAPFVSTYLVKTTGSPAAPALYLCACGLISGLAALAVRDRFKAVSID